MITQEQLVATMVRAALDTAPPKGRDEALIRKEALAMFQSASEEDREIVRVLTYFANAFAAQGWDAGYGAAIGGVTTNPFTQTIAPSPA